MWGFPASGVAARLRTLYFADIPVRNIFVIFLDDGLVSEEQLVGAVELALAPTAGGS